MGMHRNREDGSGFDIAVLGYDRRQVDRCLDELTARLEEAVDQLGSIDVLYSQLCQAQLEADELRYRLVTGAGGGVTDNPEWADRLATIMAEAEALRRRAARDANAIRSGAGNRVQEPAGRR